MERLRGRSRFKIGRLRNTAAVKTLASYFKFRNVFSNFEWKFELLSLCVHTAVNKIAHICACRQNFSMRITAHICAYQCSISRIMRYAHTKKIQYARKPSTERLRENLILTGKNSKKFRQAIILFHTSEDPKKMFSILMMWGII